MGALEFGVVGAIYEKLGGLAPLAQSVAPVIKAQITEEYSSFDFVISGSTYTRRAFALGSVVVILLCMMSEIAMLASIALR